MVEPSNIQPDTGLINPQEEAGDFGLPNKKTQDIDDGLIEYADALESIDENNPLAKLNAVSMSDNNGGRIFF